MTQQGEECTVVTVVTELYQNTAACQARVNLQVPMVTLGGNGDLVQHLIALGRDVAHPELKVGVLAQCRRLDDPVNVQDARFLQHGGEHRRSKLRELFRRFVANGDAGGARGHAPGGCRDILCFCDVLLFVYGRSLARPHLSLHCFFGRRLQRSCGYGGSSPGCLLSLACTTQCGNKLRLAHGGVALNALELC